MYRAKATQVGISQLDELLEKLNAQVCYLIVCGMILYYVCKTIFVLSK